MTIRTAIRLTIAFFWMGLFIRAGVTEGTTGIGRTRVSKAGSTVLSVMSPKGKAEVTIHTVVVEGECLKSCPAVNLSKDYGAEEASVVQHLSISIAGKPISVPPAAYSGLFNVMWASVSYKSEVFDLTINEGVDLYLIHLYFDVRNGIIRMTVYDYLARKIVEDARFYPATIE